MWVPSGITEGSTATTPQPTGRPVEVLPGSAYPVAETEIVRPPVAGAVEAKLAEAGAMADETADPVELACAVRASCSLLSRAAAACAMTDEICRCVMARSAASEPM